LDEAEREGYRARIFTHQPPRATNLHPIQVENN
jgi:hypothetical protein